MAGDFELAGESELSAVPRATGACGLFSGLLAKGVETPWRFDTLLMPMGRLVRLVIEKVVTEGR